jgi:hypothetical protein
MEDAMMDRFASSLSCISLIVLAAACASDAERTSSSAPVNPGFEPCAEGVLCDWNVTGDIASVPTWHALDRGTELLGAPVSLTQVVDPFTGGPCVTFELIADVAASAAVVIELDFDDDGSVDYADPLPAADWTLLTYQHAVPQGARRLRVRIVKSALGRAVLARLDLSSGPCGEWSTRARIRTHARPDRDRTA